MHNVREAEKFITKIKKNQTIRGTIRKLDELGRIVIPIDYRKGIVTDGKTKFDICNMGNYVIVEILENETDKISRVVDDLGRIVINIEFRKELEWQEKDEIEVWHYKKIFILKKVENKCIFCEKNKKLVQYKEKMVCTKCLEELKNKDIK